MREKRLFYSNFAITQQTAKKLSQRPIADFILHSKSAHMHTNAPNVSRGGGDRDHANKLRQFYFASSEIQQQRLCRLLYSLPKPNESVRIFTVDFSRNV